MIEVNFSPDYNLVTVRVVKEIEESDIQSNDTELVNFLMN